MEIHGEASELLSNYTQTAYGNAEEQVEEASSQ
jgi:hypothetical protein